MKKLLVVLLALVLAGSLVAACGQPAQPTPTQPPAPTAKPAEPTVPPAPEVKAPIIIGGITDLSGNGSVLGTAVARGWELAVADINAKGGVNGRPLKLIVYDCRSDPQEAISLFKRLADVDKAAIVVGPPFSNVGLAVAPVADEKGLVFFGQFGDPRCMLGEKLDSLHPYMFLVQPSAIQTGIIGGAYPFEVLGLKKAAVLIAEDHAYCVTQANAFLDYASKVGIEIKTIQKCKIADTDLTVQLTAIKNSGAEFLFNACNTQLLVVATNQMYQMGMDIVQCGSLDFSYPFATLVSDPKAASRIYFPVNLDMEAPHLADVTAAYIATYNEKPTPKSWIAYDTILVTKAAIEKAGSDDRAAIRDALENISGVKCLITDNFSIDPKTHMPLGLGMCIYNIENGQYKNLGYYVPEYLKH
ncbi:MAG: ABC transporter substrate-binding protein [Anaerolineae bacterium]